MRAVRRFPPSLPPSLSYLRRQIRELAVLDEFTQVKERGVLRLRDSIHQRDDRLGNGLLVLKTT